MTNIDLTPIIEAIITLLAALITFKLIPWIKARTSTEQQTLLIATIKTLVFAAEQIYGAGNGQVKMDFVVKELEERGFTVDPVAVESILKEYTAEIHSLKPTTEENNAE